LVVSLLGPDKVTGPVDNYTLQDHEHHNEGKPSMHGHTPSAGSPLGALLP
jgi:hypothetical protein